MSENKESNGIGMKDLTWRAIIATSLASLIAMQTYMLNTGVPSAADEYWFLNFRRPEGVLNSITVEAAGIRINPQSGVYESNDIGKLIESLGDQAISIDQRIKNLESATTIPEEENQ